MTASHRFAWIVVAASLTLAGACKSELDEPMADPLEDPWVDAIDTGDEQAAAEAAVAEVAVPEQPASAEAVALAEPPAAEAPAEQPAGVLANPTASAEPSSATPSASASKSPAADGAAPTPSEAPAVEQPEAEAAVVDPAPAPAVDPTPAPPAEQPKPAAPPPITMADYQGSYRFTGGSAQRKGLEQAIEEAAQQLPAAFRGIGRKRLTKTNPIDDTLKIVVSGDKVQTIFETGFDAAATLDGATVNWTSDKGDKYKVRLRQKGAKIVQLIQGEDGLKTTVFVLSADRKKLTVHHKITADRLPEPMTYKLTYTRN